MPEIHKALSSQNGVAALSLNINLDNHNITINPTSLNTLKAHSNSILDEGYKGLDSLRKRALTALAIASKSTPQTNSRSKASLLCKITDLENELQHHKQSIFLLLQALSSAVSDFKNIRDASDIALRNKRTDDATKVLRAVTELVPALPASFENNTTNSVIDISIYRGKS
ncbi:hypothetical protein [Pseudomonas aeruginosa]|uniref:hypothetical protein n=1 Tax=Pseudomonas aeruginosa TaxID=287 RepID=UPI0037CA0703|nr:hypothetical protein [Pseudomonas aeruginosa]